MKSSLSSLLLISCVLSVVCIQKGSSIWLNLASAGTKCVSEEIQTNVVVLADYSVLPDDHTHATPTISVKYLNRSKLETCGLVGPDPVLPPEQIVCFPRAVLSSHSHGPPTMTLGPETIYLGTDTEMQWISIGYIDLEKDACPARNMSSMDDRAHAVCDKLNGADQQITGASNDGAQDTRRGNLSLDTSSKLSSGRVRIGSSRRTGAVTQDNNNIIKNAEGAKTSIDDRRKGNKKLMSETGKRSSQEQLRLRKKIRAQELVDEFWGGKNELEWVEKLLDCLGPE